MTALDLQLRAILDAPDDDLARLVYADLLEEHGQTERAELVRIQIELAKLAKLPKLPRMICPHRVGNPKRHPRCIAGPEWEPFYYYAPMTWTIWLPPNADCPQIGEVVDVSLPETARRNSRLEAVYGLCADNFTFNDRGEIEVSLRVCGDPYSQYRQKANDLQRRERQLLSVTRIGDAPIEPQAGLEWAGEVFVKLPWNDARWEWRRGFIETLACRAADWLAHADAILKVQPVREVRLTTWPDFELCDRNHLDAPPEDGWVRERLRGRKKWRRVKDFSRAAGGVPEAAKRILGDEWPGIEFELPPASTGMSSWIDPVTAHWEAEPSLDGTNNSPSLAEILAETKDKVIQGLGMPAELLKGNP